MWHITPSWDDILWEPLSSIAGGWDQTSKMVSGSFVSSLPGADTGDFPTKRSGKISEGLLNMYHKRPPLTKLPNQPATFL